jgi:hypothetical protein
MMEDSELLTYDQHLLTPLRELIVDKPPYMSGTLQLPTSCFSLFYKTKKDGNDTRLERHPGHGLILPATWRPLADLLLVI